MKLLQVVIKRVRVFMKKRQVLLQMILLFIGKEVLCQIRILIVSLRDTFQSVYYPVIFFYFIKKNKRIRWIVKDLLEICFELVKKWVFNRFLLVYLVNFLILVKTGRYWGDLNPGIGQLLLIDLFTWLIWCNLLKSMVGMWGKNERPPFKSFHSPYLLVEIFPSSSKRDNLPIIWATFYKSLEVLSIFWGIRPVRRIFDLNTWLLQVPEGSGALILLGILQFSLSVAYFLFFLFLKNRNYDITLLDKNNQIVYLIRWWSGVFKYSKSPSEIFCS